MSNGPDDDRILEHLLVLRAQTQDRSAYTRLFDRYDARLRYYVRRLLASEADVEDALQDTWLSVVRKLHTLDDPGAFRAWLYRIARNHTFSRLRRTKREVPLESLDEQSLPAQAAEDETSFADFDAAALHAGLERLPPTQREVLTLRFLESLTYEDIASVVGCNVGTVRSRIHYGKRALLAELTTQPRRAQDD